MHPRNIEMAALKGNPAIQKTASAQNGFDCCISTF